MSFKCVPIYGLMFRILTRFHALYFGASCIHRNSIVWRRVNLARFPYWPEKRKRRISRYSYLMKTLISSEYGLTISGHVTVLGQWLSEKNTDYKLKSSMDLNVSSSVLEALRGHMAQTELNWFHVFICIGKWPIRLTIFYSFVTVQSAVVSCMTLTEG